MIGTYLPFCLGLKEAYGRRERCSKGMSSAAMSISSYSTLAGKSTEIHELPVDLIM